MVMVATRVNDAGDSYGNHGHLRLFRDEWNGEDDDSFHFDGNDDDSSDDDVFGDFQSYFRCSINDGNFCN